MDKFEIYTFHPQPEFPVEDISEQNATVASYYLKTAVEKDVYLETFKQNLQLIHDIGNAALAYLDTNPGNNRGEYNAFCEGFATMDYLVTLIDSRPFKQLVNGAGMDNFFLQHDGFEDVEFAKRIKHWRSSHENTMMLLLDVSDRSRDTQKQFAARLVGAQAASELYYVA